MPVQLEHASWGAGVPLSLRVIACVFILGGVLSVAEMVLQLIVFGQVSIDVFGPVWIFTGRGLLRWREGWRQWAVFVTWVVLIGVIVGVLITVWDLCFGIRGLRSGWLVSRRPGPVGALVVGTLLTTYLYWQQRVLRRLDIVERFRSPPPAPARRRWQFSLGSLLVAVTFIAFLAARVCSDDVRYRVEHHSLSTRTSGNTPLELQGFEYGTRVARFSSRPAELLYAVLSHGQQITGAVGLSVRRYDATATVELADDTSVELPTENQLFDAVEGRAVPRDGHVTFAEFEDFVSESRADWSVGGLLEHARQMREKRKVKQANESK